MYGKKGDGLKSKIIYVIVESVIRNEWRRMNIMIVKKGKMGELRSF